MSPDRLVPDWGREYAAEADVLGANESTRVWEVRTLEEAVARAGALLTRYPGKFRAWVVRRSPESGRVLERWMINQNTGELSHVILPEGDACG